MKLFTPIAPNTMLAARDRYLAPCLLAPFADDMARRMALAKPLLEQLVLRNAGAGMTWGYATFHWGSAIYAEPGPAPRGSP